MKTKIVRPDIVYWAITSVDDSPGIFNKVVDFVETAKDLGYKTDSILVKPGPYREYIAALFRLYSVRPDVVIMRYNNLSGIALAITTIMLRLRGVKVILDVPTPIVYHIRSVLNKKWKGAKDVVEIINALALGPLPFFLANLVLHYSRESRYFTPKHGCNVLLIGNSIRSKRIPYPVIGVDNFQFDSINMIAVGAVASWHGWDIVIQAISLYRRQCNSKPVSLNIVGEGPAKHELMKLVCELELNDVVKFSGMTTGGNLSELYSKANLAIGSFGWHRLGLQVASPLKYREYLANGLPFLYATDDPDLEASNRVAFKLKPNATEIADFFGELKLASLPSKVECFEYCRLNMDYSAKIPKIMQALNN